MSGNYRVGPARMLVASAMSDPISSWVDAGVTIEGIAWTPKPAEIAFGKIDQITRVPHASSLYISPGYMEIKAKLADHQVATMAQMIPDGVRVTSGAKTALRLPSVPQGMTTKAVAVIPVDEYNDDLSWVNSEHVIWFENAIIQVDEAGMGNAVEDGAALRTFDVTIGAASGANGLGYPLVAAPTKGVQGALFAWQPALDGLTPLVGEGAGTFTRATTATYIDDDGVVQSVGSGVHRIQDGGLLLEPQRTNLALYSEAFDNAAWTKSGTTVVANDATAPDGTATADRVYPATSGNSATRFVLQQATAASAVYTASIFVKQAGKTAVAFYGADGTTLACYVNLLTGVASNVAGSYTVSVTNIGSGWYRVAITSPTATNPYLIAAAVDAAGSTTVTASGTNGIFVWGAGIEAGSYPTSYIPTTGATATRNADALTIPFTTGLPAEGMTALVKGTALDVSNATIVRVGSVGSTPSSTEYAIRIRHTGVSTYTNPGGASSASATGGVVFAKGVEDDLTLQVNVAGDTMRLFDANDAPQSTVAIVTTVGDVANDGQIENDLSSSSAWIWSAMVITSGLLTPAQIRKYLR